MLFETDVDKIETRFCPSLGGIRMSDKYVIRGVDEEELEKEICMIKEYVKNNPYPSYDEMVKRILAVPERDIAMKWYAEYGEQNHYVLRMCYENITDKHKCKEVGKYIYNRGGHTAMCENYMVLRYLGPFHTSNNNVIRYYARLVSAYWDGIGEWQD